METKILAIKSDNELYNEAIEFIDEYGEWFRVNKKSKDKLRAHISQEKLELLPWCKIDNRVREQLERKITPLNRLNILNQFLNNIISEEDLKDTLYQNQFNRTEINIITEISILRTKKSLTRRLRRSNFTDEEIDIILKVSKGTLTNNQIRSLENICNSSQNIDRISEFIKHQGKKSTKNYYEKEFWNELKIKLDKLREENTIVVEGFDYLIIKEFIQHLAAEHRFRNPGGK